MTRSSVRVLPGQCELSPGRQVLLSEIKPLWRGGFSRPTQATRPSVLHSVEGGRISSGGGGGGGARASEESRP